MTTTPQVAVERLIERLKRRIAFQRKHGGNLYYAKVDADDDAELVTAIESLSSQLAEARGALEATKNVIERGYDRVTHEGRGAAAKCQHGQFHFQDCIGCYDEALIAALTLPPEPRHNT